MNTGVIDSVPFGSIADFRNGVNFSSSCRDNRDGTLAVIGVGDFQANERISDFDHLERIVMPRKLGDDALLQDGDLVFVRSNGSKALIGRCMRVEDVDCRLTHSGFTIRARMKHGSVSSEWVLQFFATGLAAQAITRLGRGTNISNLSQDVLRQLHIPVPSERYAGRVLVVSEKLSQLSKQLCRLIEEKRALTLGLAQQLLTSKKRFAEFRDTPWVVVRLGDVFDERAKSDRDDLPLLSVTGDRGVIPRDQLKKRDTSNADKSKYKRVAPGDIAYNTMRMWQGVSALSSLEGIISPAYTVAVPTPRIDGGFAKHLFKFPPVVHLFHRHSQGLVDDTLNLKYKRFAKIRLRIPEGVEEQKKIAAVLDLCDKELALLMQQQEQYQRYKRGLMSRLLSGEIQVPA